MTDPRRPVAGMVLEPWLGGEVWCYSHRVRSIVEALDVAATRHPERVGLVTPQRSVTWAEFADLVEGAAASLVADDGLRPGDRLAVALPNGLDIAVAIWACARAGLVLVGLSTRLRAPQWAYQLRQSGARLALGDPALLGELQVAGAEAGTPAVRGVGASLASAPPLGWRGGDLAFPDADDVYGLIYTSGTTGRPKGSQVTHRGTTHAATTYLRTFGLVAADVTLLTFPLSYATAHMAQVTPMMLAGGRCVTVPEVTGPAVVRAVAEHRVTYLMVVPSLWPLLLARDDFAWPALGHLRVGAFGGSPMPVSTIAALRRRMPQLRLFDAYGLTETHSPATILLDAEMGRKPGSVGRPIPGCEARIVDDAGAVLGVDEPGELQLRGPMITPGYHDDPAATARAISADGWLATGDLARIDDEGYVFVLDRVKDMIIRGGFKVYSVELEYLLVSHPDVVEAAVVGIPEELGFEAVCAFVVPRPGAAVSVSDVRRWVAARMADYAVPRHVRVVNEIPRNRTGKIEKPQLREDLLAELRRSSR